MGTIGLHGVDVLTLSAMLGYWIATSSAGRGLMTEAGARVVRFALEDLRLHRIGLYAAPDNVPSVRVAEKLGLRREGVLRDGNRGMHGWHDVYVFGLLRDDPIRGGVAFERVGVHSGRRLDGPDKAGAAGRSFNGTHG